MRRALVALVAVVLMLPGVVLGSSFNVGEHLHWEVKNHPVDGHPIAKAPYTFHIKAQTHDQVKATRWFRVDNESTSFPAVKLVLGPGNAVVEFDYTIDFSKWSTGRHELRWHLDLSPNDEGNRQFTTSRSQVCVGLCSANVSGRTSPFNGGGSWYLGEYATAYVLSKDTDIRPGGSIKVRAAQDAKAVCVFQNPDFHNGSSGTRLGCWNDTSNHVVPLTGVVGDKILVIATQPNGNAGAIRLFLGDGSDKATADYEYMSWWAHGGVVFP